MRLLLDTNVLLWWRGEVRLKADTRSLIADQANECFVSSISVWETRIKQTLGKLEMDDVGALPLTKLGFAHLDFTMEHANEVATLPLIHGDPFDRALLAQAKSEGLVFLTGDKALAPYGSFVKVV